jgi:hypothetical protein
LLLPNFQADAGHISKAEVHDDQLWTRYLAEGTQEWMTHAHPPVTPSLEAAVWRSLDDGTAAANPMVEFLLWRQSLDPARFDFYHPRLAIAFKNLKSPTVSPTTTTTTSTTPTTSTATTVPETFPNLQPEAQLVPTVPEPATLWVAVAMLSWAAWITRKRRATAGA